MSVFQRHDWRIAERLQQLLQTENQEVLNLGLIPNSVRTLGDQLSLLGTTKERGWPMASRYLLRQVQTTLLRLQQQVQETIAALDRQIERRSPPSQRELYQELLDLRTEFDDCQVNLRQGTLSVVTEPIVLDGHELGPFRIELNWKHAGPQSTPTYKVVALEPNHPDSRSEITHPHVMRDHLCEGDAKPALTLAFQSGRLTDFFQIVDRVLHTYNSGSPYAHLSEWDGVECHACGTNTSQDSDYCSNCRGYVCDGCSISCSACSEHGCDSCQSRCERCTASVCLNCSKSCSECGQKVCPDCLTTTELCEDCDAAQQMPTDSDTAELETESEGSAATPVQPAGLGQDAISA